MPKAAVTGPAGVRDLAWELTYATGSNPPNPHMNGYAVSTDVLPQQRPRRGRRAGPPSAPQREPRSGPRPRPWLWADEIPVRADLRAASRFPAADYADNFEVPVAEPGRTAEQWARVVFEDATTAVQRLLIVWWRLLGFQLGPRQSGQHVLGWRIVRNSPDVIVLQSRSLAGFTGRLVLAPRGTRLVYGTFVRCDGLLAKIVCLGVAPIHRLLVSRVLGDAAQ
ncbi:MAG TPA: DUF2867 domain-containing protein [Streptosporangiaceae bacterium]